jgi:hypothetical protein
MKGVDMEPVEALEARIASNVETVKMRNHYRIFSRSFSYHGQGLTLADACLNFLIRNGLEPNHG